MVAVPVLAGALLRFLNGILVGQWKPRNVGLVMQLVVIAGLLTAWLVEVFTACRKSCCWAWCWASRAQASP